MDYAIIKLIHQCTVVLSVAGFFVRGVASFFGATWVRGRAAKTLPHFVDSVFLLSGLTLAWILKASPGNAPWLLAKVFGLVAYVILGTIALRPGRSNAIRAVAWVSALVMAFWIVSVAITKDPSGFLRAIF